MHIICRTIFVSKSPNNPPICKSAYRMWWGCEELHWVTGFSSTGLKHGSQYIKQWRSSIYIYVLPKYYSIYKQLGKGSTILYCCDTVAIIGDYTFIFHSIPLVPKHLTISTNGLPSFLQLVSNPKYQLTSLLKRLMRAQVTQRPKWTLSARTATLLSILLFYIL